MSICPRGYFAALKSYYPFPTYQALDHARKVCAGELQDAEGIRKVSVDNYINVKVPDIDGFTRRHAEGWINVCTGTPCVLKQDPRCRPQHKYDEKTGELASEADHDMLCNVNTRHVPILDDLYHSLLEGGVVPFGQVLHKGKCIGIMNTDKHFHICLPSAPLPGVNTIELG